MAARRTGLQLDVLALYRRALRLVRTKPAHTQTKFATYIRYHFHQKAHSISPRDINAIEYLMRTGRRQLEQLEDRAVKDCIVTRAQLDWAAQSPGQRRKGDKKKT